MLAPVGGPAPQAQESAPRPVETPRPVTGQVPMKEARPLTPPVLPEPGDDRPRLPRREPQANLVSQLEDEPDDALNDVPTGDGTARSLAAFHKGTRRGRDGADDS